MLNSTRTKYYSAINRIITAREQSCAKVMFSVVSFCSHGKGPKMNEMEYVHVCHMGTPPWPPSLIIQRDSYNPVPIDTFKLV